MKTTNFEISKKLKEIGFKAKTDKCWAKIRNSKLDEFSIRTLDFSIPANCDEWYPSYDLETLLEALPKELDKFLGITYLSLNKSNSGINIGYGNDEEYVENLYCWQEENESLADTAGRMLIKLYEAGIINFKE